MKRKHPRTLIGYLIFAYAIFVVIAVIFFVNYCRSYFGLNKKEELSIETENIVEQEEAIDLDEVLNNFENNVINTNIDNVKIVKEYMCTNGDAVYKIENNSDERVFAQNIRLCYYSPEAKGYKNVPTYPSKVYIPANSFSYLYVYNEKGNVDESFILEKCELDNLYEYNYLTDAVVISDFKKNKKGDYIVGSITNTKDTPITSSSILVIFFKGETPVGVQYGIYNLKIPSEGTSAVIITYPIDYETQETIMDFDSFDAICLHSTY